MKKILCTVVLVYILVNIRPGSAIRCYQCEDVLGEGLHCESNVKDVLTPNCTETFVCLKYIYHTDNTTAAIHRGCAPESKCEELKASLSGLEYCGTCPTSLCNSAPMSYRAVSLSSPILFFIIACIGLYQ
ncbi:uncharacterized protein LOC108911261 [Anoplophora glabripennis]|uniref:uncharacterized protein LOC108911261 n=1 Tax=Anoplophora glabripennis TaxID=217634 RepID=UPI0008738C9D|nr:uncharacterized protein LOC108911261 [Anoplophora glabripennis]